MSPGAYSDCTPCVTGGTGAYGYWLAIVVVIAIAIWFAFSIFTAIDNNIEKVTEDDEDNGRNISSKWWHALIAAIVALIVVWLISCWIGCGGCGTKGMMMGY